MNLKHIFWFCFLEFLLWCLLSLAYFGVSGFYPSWTGGLFTALFIPGNAFMFAVGLFVLLALLRLIGPKTALWGAVGLGGAFNVALSLDVFVYTQYRFHISLSMLQLFFGPAGREIFVFPASMWVLFGLAVCLMWGLSAGLAVLARKTPWSGKTIGAVACILLLVWGGYNAM